MSVGASDAEPRRIDAEPRRIDAVVFDFGGVFTPSPFEAAHVYAAEQGADPAVLIEIVFGALRHRLRPPLASPRAP